MAILPSTWQKLGMWQNARANFLLSSQNHLLAISLSMLSISITAMILSRCEAANNSQARNGIQLLPILGTF
eukprot:695082-Pleurochrysis_carterae.AAC.1